MPRSRCRSRSRRWSPPGPRRRRRRIRPSSSRGPERGRGGSGPRLARHVWNAFQPGALSSDKGSAFPLERRSHAAHAPTPSPDPLASGLHLRRAGGGDDHPAERAPDLLEHGQRCREAAQRQPRDGPRRLRGPQHARDPARGGLREGLLPLQLGSERRPGRRRHRAWKPVRRQGAGRCSRLARRARGRGHLPDGPRRRGQAPAARGRRAARARHAARPLGRRPHRRPGSRGLLLHPSGAGAPALEGLDGRPPVPALNAALPLQQGVTMNPRPRSKRAGWTLIELLLASVLVVGVMTKAAFVVNAALGLAGDETASMHYEDQARAVIDRIAIAVMGSDRETLIPQIEEVHTNSIKYSFSLGLEDGEVVWSAPEEIRLGDGGNTVQWSENPGAAEERRAVWTTLVSPLLEGEVVNGVDDNGNGLIDEDGLSFVLDGERIVIRLTLRRPEVDGRIVQQTVEQVVHCRN